MIPRNKSKRRKILWKHLGLLTAIILFFTASFSDDGNTRPAGSEMEIIASQKIPLEEGSALIPYGDEFLMIGDRSKLPKTVVELIDHAESTTVNNTGLTLVLALSYGGRQEIVAAVKSLCERVKNNDLHIDAIDDAIFASCLFTNSVPDPDLVIRTSGEQRVSNFLLWQIAYSEFVFMDVLWPDFGKHELLQAITEYQSRERRYGASEKPT